MTKVKSLTSMQANFGGVFTASYGVTKYGSQKQFFFPSHFTQKTLWSSNEELLCNVLEKFPQSS